MPLNDGSAKLETKVEPDIKFSLYTTEILKASMGPDGKKRIRGIASSTTKDFHGDTILPSAIEDMVRDASGNMTIFLNHSYEVPEDVAGSVERASSRVKSVDHAGAPNTDLILDIIVNESNPRAVATWEALNNGTKLGLSIGANLPKGGYHVEKDGSYIIDHIDLMETSIVSLPANPRSWVEYAVKALDPNKVFVRTAPVAELIVGEAGVEAAQVLTSVVPEVVAETETPEVAAVVTPEEAKATIAITIDTQSHGSGSATPASQASPDAEDGVSAIVEELPGEGALLEDAATKDTIPAEVFTGIADQFKSLTDELVRSREFFDVEKKARIKAESERDTANDERDRVLKEVAALLARLADTPLVRRTAAFDAQKNFKAKFGAWFDDDILSIMEKH